MTIILSLLTYSSCYVEDTLYSTNKYSCVRRVHTLYISYQINFFMEDCGFKDGGGSSRFLRSIAVSLPQRRFHILQDNSLHIHRFRTWNLTSKYVYLSAGTNVALRKPANQSTTVRGGAAANGNDGESTTVHDGKRCTETMKEASPWWMVDLLKPYPIGVVRVTTRGCCGKQITLTWDSVGCGRVSPHVDKIWT